MKIVNLSAYELRVTRRTTVLGIPSPECDTMFCMIQNYSGRVVYSIKKNISKNADDDYIENKLKDAFIAYEEWKSTQKKRKYENRK